MPSNGGPVVAVCNPPLQSPLCCGGGCGDRSLDRDLQMCRQSIAKWGEYRGANQLSVRALIDSIESATKQKLSSSHSSSNSSISSINNSPPLIANPFILERDNNYSQRIVPSISCDVKDSIESVDNSVKNSVNNSVDKSAFVRRQSPTSKQKGGLSTNKLDPNRRSSYGYGSQQLYNFTNKFN